MRLKFIWLFIFIFIAFPSFAQTFEANNFSDFKSALATAKSAPNDTHTINIKGDIQFESTVLEALNLEIAGNNNEFDLNGFTLNFLGSDKTSKISNLKILESSTTSGIIGRNKSLTVENSTLSGHSRFGRELIKNTDGELIVTNSSLLNNYAEKGAGINFSGTNLNIQKSTLSGNKANYGGAVYLDKGNIEITNSEISNNTSSAGGGAVYINQSATAVLDNVKFNENKISSGSSGGAIFNNGNLTVKNNSVFSNNSVSLGSGGAITNKGTLNIDSAIFENNISKQDGGAITDTGSSVIKNSVFRNNQSQEYIGGAIASTGETVLENCLFENNSAGTFGGAIALMQSNATISDTKFVNNTAKSSFGGGAIINYLSNVDLTGDILFQKNTSNTNGGAISTTINSTTNISSGAQFIDNSAEGSGGGIFSQGTINITSDNPDKNVLFSGNKDSNGSNAIHLDIYNNNPSAGTLNINVSNGSAVIFKDNLSGVKNTVANIKGTSSTNDKIYFGSGNENFRSNVNFKDISLEFYNESSGLPNAVINAENTHFNFMNGAISVHKLNLNLSGRGNCFSIDIDPANLSSDYFDFGDNTAIENITIRDINVLSNPIKSSTTFDIFDHDKYGTNLTLSEELNNRTVYGAVKKYKFVLNPKLTLVELFEYNPNIQRYQSATASAFMNQLLSYDYSLNRTDEIYSNLRALSISQMKSNSYVNIGRNRIYYDRYDKEGAAMWIRPYVNLESFHLSGTSSGVGNQSYGTMIGFDFPMVRAKDWKIFSTFYGAYIGSSQEYEDSNIYQNGGYLGYLLSAYKDNFYAGWTINGGGLGVASHYANGKDDYAIITAGTALKLAFNWKLKRLIVQPNFTTAYTFLNPTDLTSFQSIDIAQSQVNGLTIMPAVRITYKNESGFEPYIFAGCVIPLMSDIKAKTDSTYLEKLTLNAWAQFGAGVRKRFGKRVTCFAETIIRTGGRVGWGCMFNLQIAL